MDLSVLIVGGIAGIGYYLNRQGRQVRDQDVLRTTVSADHHPNTYHAYEDNRLPHVRKQEEAMAKHLEQQSQHPAETRVIPPFFNTFGKKKDSVQSRIGMEKIPELLTPEVVKKQVGKKKLDELSPVRRAYDRQPQEFGNFPVENFMNVGFHTNMVPHTSRRDVEQFGDISGSLFETTAAYGDNIITHKQDVPSFHKITPQNNVHGQQFYGDDLQNRARMNASFKKNDERPFQPLQTAPSTTQAGRGGLAGDEGYHPMFRPTDYLSVDQLRAKNNPKITFDASGLEGAAKSFISAGPSVMDEQKNHPEREHTLNFNHVVGGHTAQNAGMQERPFAYPSVKNNQRTTLATNNYMGPAVGNETGNRLVPERFMLGGKLEEDTNGYRGPATAEEKHTYARDQDYQLYPTLKEQTTDEYTGNVGSDRKQTKWYNTTPERTTLKEQTHEEYSGIVGSDRKQTSWYNMTPERNTHRVSTDAEYYQPAAPGESGSHVCRENQYNAEINALKEAAHAPWVPNTEYNKVEASRFGGQGGVISRKGMISREDPKMMNAVHINVQQQNRNDTQCRIVPQQGKTSLRGSGKGFEQRSFDIGQLDQLNDNPYQTTPLHKL
jgi:hypothetical protein